MEQPELDEVLARLFFADNRAWVVMRRLLDELEATKKDRDKWKAGLEGIE